MIDKETLIGWLAAEEATLEKILADGGEEAVRRHLAEVRHAHTLEASQDGEVQGSELFEELDKWLHLAEAWAVDNGIVTIRDTHTVWETETETFGEGQDLDWWKPLLGDKSRSASI